VIQELARVNFRVGKGIMTQPAKEQEPSMEEILASIRKIISDDPPSAAQTSLPGPTDSPMLSSIRPATSSPSQAAFAEQPSAPRREPSQAEIDAMLVQLRETRHEPAVQEAPPGLRGEHRLEPAPPPSFDNQVSRGSEQPHVESAAPEPSAGESALMSAGTAAQVGSAFNRLAQAVAAPRGPTLEEMVTGMLRPMLKTWLDENLPAMVERLVQAEIERVARKS
jgi:uncharacterized protein